MIGHPVAKTAVVAKAVTPGPAPVAKTAVVAAAVTPGRRRRIQVRRTRPAVAAATAQNRGGPATSSPGRHGTTGPAPRSDTSWDRCPPCDPPGLRPVRAGEDWAVRQGTAERQRRSQAPLHC